MKILSIFGAMLKLSRKNTRSAPDLQGFNYAKLRNT